MKYYYANAANQPTGPVTLDELRLLHARGEITPTTNIIPVGETVWRPLSTVISAVPSSATPAPLPPSAASATTASVNPTSAPNPSVPPPAPAGVSMKPADVAKLPTLLATFIGRLIVKARGLLSIPRLTALFAGANSLGQILVLIGAALALIYGLVYAIKYNSFEIFLYGVGAVFVLAVLQFIAKRLLEACASILKTSPTRVASVAVIECLGLLLLLAAIGSLVQGIVVAIQLESLIPLVPALVFFVLLAATGGVALHPSLANVEEAPAATAGEEAIGLFSFFAKTTLVLQPLLFATYAAAGVIVVLLNIFGQDAAFSEALLAALPFSFPAMGGMIGAAIIATACLFPLFAYLSFLAYYLLIDVLRAILSIPAKLDQLRR